MPTISATKGYAGCVPWVAHVHVTHAHVLVYVHSRSRARGTTRCPRAPLTPLGSLWSFVKPYLGGNPPIWTPLRSSRVEPWAAPSCKLPPMKKNFPAGGNFVKSPPTCSIALNFSSLDGAQSARPNRGR